jgi:glutamate synthase (NADPH/NADH) small chain
MDDSKRVPERVLPPEVAVTTFDEVRRGYSKDAAIREARRLGDADITAVQAACPFGVDVQRMVEAVADGDFDGGLRVVLEAHPWPGILGRHCSKYCESAHSLGEGKEPLALGNLERAVAEHGNRRELPLRAGPPTGKSVALIGAGSASSATAYRLRQYGHAVTIYERLPRAGGMMLAGYPSFRLPEGVIREENPLADWGVETRYDTEIDAAGLQELQQRHDAVVIGTGTHAERPLGIPGESAAGVWSALKFLTAFKTGDTPSIGRQVAVFGAGHTAQDASRTCVRLGATVRIFYRRSLDDMPIRPSRRVPSVQLLAREGIDYMFNTMPVEIVTEAGRVVGVRCVRTEHVQDEEGRPRRLVPVPGSEFFYPCDTVLRATGVYPELDILPWPAQDPRDEWISVDSTTWQTRQSGVFAIGTVAGTVKTVNAFKSGLDAAEHIHEYVTKDSTRPSRRGRNAQACGA